MRTAEWVDAIERWLLEVLVLAGVGADPTRVENVKGLATLARRSVATGRVEEKAEVVRKAVKLSRLPGYAEAEDEATTALEQLVAWAQSGALLTSCEHRDAQLGCRACVERVRRDIHEFPLQADRAPPGPRSIPWAVADRAYPAYAEAGGRGQSLERLAERGGLSWGEMDLFFPAWREAVDEWKKLRARVAEFEQRVESQEAAARARKDGSSGPREHGDCRASPLHGEQAPAATPSSP